MPQSLKKSLLLATIVALLLVSLPLSATSATWTNVALVDQNCSVKVKADPDAHTRDCAMQCAKSGYGLYTADGQYLKLDAEGTKLALAALEASTQKDKLRVDVTGELAGETIRVTSLAMVQ